VGAIDHDISEAAMKDQFARQHTSPHADHERQLRFVCESLWRCPQAPARSRMPRGR
jgi:hypothetical protein